jgi:branched-chain amino acid transport system ATP-binding protein
MATHPRILLIDESMAGLAPNELESVLGLLRLLKSRASVILIEHNLSVVAKVSDTIIVMHRGTKVAEGSPDEIVADRGVQKVYLGEKYA